MNPTMVSPPECRDQGVKPRTPPASRMFSTDLGGTSLPARGLVYSVLAHALCAVVSLWVPWSYWFPDDVHLASAQSMIEQREEIFLPDLQPMGNNSPAAPSSSSKELKPRQEARASSSSATAVQGVVFKGPQLIVSNPPHPDNAVQTIRQPDLPLRPKLPAPLQMPPLVSIASAKPVLAPPAPQPEPEVSHPPVLVAAASPIHRPSQQPRVEAPKLALPAASSADVLRRASAAAPATMPMLARQVPLAAAGDQAHNILVVNAVAVPDKPAALPPGELFGAFTVSPQAVTARPGAAGMGVAGGLAANSVPGAGNASGAGAGASPNAGGGGKSAGATGEGSLARAGVGSGAGSGRGSGKETGSGSGTAGRGSGKGVGPGSGSGNSPFPGIMIQGGNSGERRSVRAPGGGASTPQGSYGITIVANGASGGGFKDFGVFREEASYTVYVDMTDAGAYGSSWTLQYALDTSNRGPYSHGLLTPPYATSKLIPHISSEAARRDRGTTIVVFGVINPQGKFENLRIMQSPDPSLNEIMLNSLAKWVFRPAEIDGAQVRVKVLLGVPVNSVPMRE